MLNNNEILIIVSNEFMKYTTDYILILFINKQVKLLYQAKIK